MDMSTLGPGRMEFPVRIEMKFSGLSAFECLLHTHWHSSFGLLLPAGQTIGADRVVEVRVVDPIGFVLFEASGLATHDVTGATRVRFESINAASRQILARIDAARAFLEEACSASEADADVSSGWTGESGRAWVARNRMPGGH